MWNTITSTLYGIVQFITGNGDPWWTHAALLGGDAIATIVVGTGIILETPKYSTGTHRIANWLVVFGIAIETLFSICLFVFDEGISHAQQEKIAGLEKRIAPRELGPSARAIIARAMSKWTVFPSVPVRQSVAVFPTSDAFESAHLADEIAMALGNDGAGWTVNRNSVTYGHPFLVSGVALIVSNSSRARMIGDELQKALEKEDIQTFTVPQVGMDCTALKMSDKLETNPACSSISIMVGSHP